MPIDQSDKIRSTKLFSLTYKILLFLDSVANVNSMPKRKDLLNPPSNADFYGLSCSRSLSRSSSNGVGLAAVGAPPQKIPVLSLVTGKAAMAGKNAFLQVNDNPSIWDKVLTQCLKITLNVTFEFLNPGIFHQFLSGNTVWPQASGFQKLDKTDQFWDL